MKLETKWFTLNVTPDDAETITAGRDLVDSATKFLDMANANGRVAQNGQSLNNPERCEECGTPTSELTPFPAANEDGHPIRLVLCPDCFEAYWERLEDAHQDETVSVNVNGSTDAD